MLGKFLHIPDRVFMLEQLDSAYVMNSFDFISVFFIDLILKLEFLMVTQNDTYCISCCFINS